MTRLPIFLLLKIFHYIGSIAYSRKFQVDIEKIMYTIHTKDVATRHRMNKIGNKPLLDLVPIHPLNSEHKQRQCI